MKTYISISFYHRKATDALYCRVVYDGTKQDIPTHIKVSAVRWSSKTQRVLGKGEEADMANATLESIRKRLSKAYQSILSAGDEDKLSAHYIRAVFEGKVGQKMTVMKMVAANVEYKREEAASDRLSAGSIAQYDRMKRDLQEFIQHQYKVDDINLELVSQPGRLEYQFADDYIKWCRTHRSWKDSTIFKETLLVSNCFNFGIKRGYIHLNPFKRVNITMPPREDFKYLTQEEIDKIAAEYSSHEEEICLDTFVLACETGLAYADISKLTYDHISRGIEKYDWIFIARQKTRRHSNKVCKIPLTDKANEIIAKYKNHPYKEASLVVPLRSNGYLNETLKSLKDRAEIKKHVTMHVARHSFAVKKLDEGYTFEAVAEMLGHADTAMLRKVYGEIRPERIAMEKSTLEKNKLQSGIK